LLNVRKAFVAQGRLAEQSDQNKGDGATPGDQQKAVNEAQRIRLKAQPGGDEIGRTRRSRCEP